MTYLLACLLKIIVLLNSFGNSSKDFVKISNVRVYSKSLPSDSYADGMSMADGTVI